MPFNSCDAQGIVAKVGINEMFLPNCNCHLNQMSNRKVDCRLSSHAAQAALNGTGSVARKVSKIQPPKGVLKKCHLMLKSATYRKKGSNASKRSKVPHIAKKVKSVTFAQKWLKCQKGHIWSKMAKKAKNAKKWHPEGFGVTKMFLANFEKEQKSGWLKKMCFLSFGQVMCQLLAVKWFAVLQNG